MATDVRQYLNPRPILPAFPLHPVEQELIVQLRHYNSTSKRDALAGLKTIVDRHRTFAEVNFARLAEASLELAVCFDNDVRR